MIIRETALDTEYVGCGWCFKINCFKCNLVAHAPLSGIPSLYVTWSKIKFSVIIHTC